MLATIMFFVGILMLIAASYGMLKTAFQASPVWGVLSFLVLPFILFALKYFARVRYCLMVLLLGFLCVVIALYGGADKTLRLRQMADLVGIGHYPLVNLLRYSSDKVVSDSYSNIEHSDDVWPVVVEQQSPQVEARTYRDILVGDLPKYIGSYVRLTSFSGDKATGYINKVNGDSITLSVDQLNPKASFNYNMQLLESVEVADN